MDKNKMNGKMNEKVNETLQKCCSHNI